jgi:hypothetical protein
MQELLTTSGWRSRRSVLRRGLALAVSLPALASMLRTPQAFADDDDNDADDDDRQRRRPAPPAQRVNNFDADLITVAQSAASGDFSSSNPGSDPLANGRVRLRRRRETTGESRLQVELRGAAANVSYDVFLWPATSAKPREALGTIGPTNNAGNLNVVTPNALGGLNRVGVFVIVRHDGSDAGKDEFISSMGG